MAISQKISNNPKSADAVQYFSKYLDKQIIIREKSRVEIDFFEMLKLVLNPMNIEIETQFRVLNYRLDGYLPKYNLALEYDEAQHLQISNITKDEQREKRVVQKLNCKFIRLDFKNSHLHNLGLIMNFILENTQPKKKIYNKIKRQEKILELLKDSKLSTKELSIKMKVSKSTILKDLKTLRNNFYIEKIRNGRNIFYKLV